MRDQPQASKYSQTSCGYQVQPRPQRRQIQIVAKHVAGCERKQLLLWHAEPIGGAEWLSSRNANGVMQITGNRQYIDAMIDGTRFDALRNLRPAIAFAVFRLPKVS